MFVAIPVLWLLLIPHSKLYAVMTDVLSSLFHLRDFSDTCTFFHFYTCYVYCWYSVQLLEFNLFGSLIHVSQPIWTTLSNQWFTSDFLRILFHNNTLAFNYIPLTAKQIRSFSPLKRAPTGRTENQLWHFFPTSSSCKKGSIHSFEQLYSNSTV